jgi:hypothetical protein
MLSKAKTSAIRRQLSNGGVNKLFVAPVAGKDWVASHYWAAPLATNVARLIGVTGPGVWALTPNAKGPALTLLEGERVPDLAQVVPVNLDAHVALEPMYLTGLITAKGFTYTKDGCQVFTFGNHICAVNLNYVAALVGDLTIGNGTDGYGTARAILKGSDPCKPLSVWRELWVTPTSGTKNGDGTPKQRYVSLILAGIVMPVSIR